MESNFTVTAENKSSLNACYMIATVVVLVAEKILLLFSLHFSV